MAEVKLQTIDKETTELLAKLNFISNISQNYRVYVKTLTMFPINFMNRVFDSPKRWFYEGSRFTDLDDIDKVINDAIAKIDKLTSREVYFLLVDTLARVPQGLEKYALTYPGDKGVSSRVKAITDKIDLVLSTSECIDIN